MTRTNDQAFLNGMNINQKTLKPIFLKELICCFKYGSIQVNYHQGDERLSANHLNDFTILRTLTDLGFIKKCHHSKFTFKITRLGKQYINQIRPENNQKLLKLFKQMEQIGQVLLIISFALIVTKSSLVIWIWLEMIATAMLGIGFFLRLDTSEEYPPVNTCKNTATEENFLQFLRAKHISEPSVRFDYHDDAPKIHTVMFEDF